MTEQRARLVFTRTALSRAVVVALLVLTGLVAPQVGTVPAYAAPSAPMVCAAVVDDLLQAELRADLEASVVEILRRAKAAEPDRDAVRRAALALQPGDVTSLTGRQRRELLAELRRRAEADLLAAHPHMGGCGIDDQDAAFVALAMRIPYRNRHFEVPSDCAEQSAKLAERIAPVASALSSVLDAQRSKRIAGFV